MQKGKKEIIKKNKTLERLSIKYVPIDSIKPNEYNPNRESEFEFDLLLRSMKEDGFTQPVLVQKDNRIVDGEHRWMAAKQLGYKEIPVVFVDMSSEQMRISTLRHNRARGTEDVELTTAVLRDLERLGALDWAKDSLKLTDVEVQRLLEDIPASEALAGIDFSKAWEPLDSSLNKNTTITENECSTGRVGEATTVQAYDLMRKREEAIRNAKSNEDLEQIKKENMVYRFSLVFSNEEVDIVKKVLGDKPAEKILEMCKKELEKNKLEEE